MWGSSEKMARTITESAISQGVEVKTLKLRAVGLTEVVTESLDAKACRLANTQHPDVSNAELFPDLCNGLEA